MSSPEIRSSLDTSVIMRLLTGQPLELATAARLPHTQILKGADH